MASAAETAAVGFGFLEERLRAAVERAAAANGGADEGLRGLYISDEEALSLAAGPAALDADARVGAVAQRLGLDALDSAVLAVCAAPELHRRYGFLYAYLQDDVTRRLASPRLAADLLAGDGVGARRRARLLRPRRRADRPRRCSGCCRSTGPRRWPTAPSRSPTGWPRSCSARRGELGDVGAPVPLRRVDVPPAVAGREAAVAEVERLLARADAAAAHGVRRRRRRDRGRGGRAAAAARRRARPRARRRAGRRDARRGARGPAAVPRRARRPRARPSARGCCARSTSGPTARSLLGRAAARGARR